MFGVKAPQNKRGKFDPYNEKQGRKKVNKLQYYLPKRDENRNDAKEIHSRTWFCPQIQSLFVETDPSFSWGSAIAAVRCAPQDTDFTNSVCNCFIFFGCFLRSSVPSPNWPKSLAPGSIVYTFRLYNALSIWTSTKHDFICTLSTTTSIWLIPITIINHFQNENRKFDFTGLLIQTKINSNQYSRR